MKFIFADSVDCVDPRYDFISDQSPPDREPYWDDQYPHEILGYAPYNGMLVSRAIVGDHRFSGKYSASQSMRFRRVGARKYLRYDKDKYPGSVIFGDCGAFSYHKLENPPYTAEDMVDFYGDGMFSHGCSVDHIIFDFAELDKKQEENLDPDDPRVKENKRRFEITLQNASDFLEKSKRLGKGFTPLGVVQGWSPISMASAARSLVDMGYRYIAIGGMVPLSAAAIHTVLRAIRQEIGFDIAIHLLGFAKADNIGEFVKYKIASFDTTSPLIRAFKDLRNNYYLPNGDGGLNYYSAIRIPQALESNKLNALVKEGRYGQEDFVRLERRALDLIRAYDHNAAGREETLDAVIEYTKPIVCPRDDASGLKKLTTLRERMERTLAERPWKKCPCAICSKISVEVIIFRASNRNKRRGIHNLAVFGEQLEKLKTENSDGASFEIQSH